MDHWGLADHFLIIGNHILLKNSRKAQKYRHQVLQQQQQGFAQSSQRPAGVGIQRQNEQQHHEQQEGMGVQGHTVIHPPGVFGGVGLAQAALVTPPEAEPLLPQQQQQQGGGVDRAQAGAEGGTAAENRPPPHLLQQLRNNILRLLLETQEEGVAFSMVDQPHTMPPGLLPYKQVGREAKARICICELVMKIQGDDCRCIYLQNIMPGCFESAWWDIFAVN
jgi:hypothetical protein